MTTTDTTTATPCDFPPCEDGGEPCNRHEREWGHSEGDHELCGAECTARDDRPGIETLTPRDELYIAVADYTGDQEEANAVIDAFRAQVLAEAKAETVGWLVKKAQEYRSIGGRQSEIQADVIGVLASKVDRGAVRAFLGTAHYRDAMDVHRAEVLREAAAHLRAEADRLWAPGRTAHTVMHADATRLDDLAEGGAR